MRHLALSFLILLAFGSIHAAEFTVGPVEESAASLLPVLTGTAHSQTPVLAEAPTDLVKPRFGTITVNRVPYGLVLYKSDTSAVYYNRVRIDFNRNGKLDDETPLEIPRAGKPIPVMLKFNAKETPYTVTLRGLNLNFRPRNWNAGTILFKKKVTRVALIDTTFDHKYGNAGDGMLIDLNHNGSFDVGESFSLAVFGKALMIADELYELKDSKGTLQIIPYTGKTGKLTIECATLKNVAEYKHPVLDFTLADPKPPRTSLHLRLAMPVTIDLPVGRYEIPIARLVDSPKIEEINNEFVLTHLEVAAFSIEDGKTKSINLNKPKVSVTVNAESGLLNIGLDTYTNEGVVYTQIWPSEKNEQGYYLPPSVSVTKTGDAKPFVNGRMQYG